MSVEFIDYYKNLAAEGEMMMLVLQKPVSKDGVPQYHNDGSPKYVWPAMDISKWKPGKAFYGNTGSFVNSRLDPKKLSASAVNCDYVAVMVLDDIGTKSKTPPLEPTWIMETSEGNFQWGYTFDIDNQPTVGEFTAAIKAIANAGFTDGGAINAVRNFRLPYSVNLKAGKDGFESQLIEFHPDREFTLQQICDALGVKPDEADTTRMRAIALTDDGDDEILNWVAEHGMLMERGNSSGWWGVACPNAGEHSDRNPMARYHPVHRAFTCYHEHCQHLDSTAYLNWIAENDGPNHKPGLRPELLTEKMASALSKITPSDMFQATSDRILSEIAEKEISRVERGDWYKRFVYVQADDGYFDIVARREISRSTFNALFRHISCKSMHTGRRVEASVAFDEGRHKHNGQAVIAVTYAAGDGDILTRDGDLYANRWRDARPDVSGWAGGDISRWLDHCRLLVPEERELNHIWDYMAFKLQHPEIKINHAILHGGDEGCGKDSLYAPWIWAVCGPNLANRGIVDIDSITSQWGYHLESEILILNELKEPEAAARRALANKLKPIIAAPPEMLSINRKGLSPYNMANRLCVLAFSNDAVPISLAAQDRRWFCVWSAAPRMSAEAASSLWDWYHKGGFQMIAAWLHARDVSQFNPAATPMETEFKGTMIDNGRSVAESFIVDEIVNKRGDFAKGIVGSPWFKHCDRLAGIAPNHVKVPQAALLHALTEAGWVNMGRIASGEYPNKKQIFCTKELAETRSKSDLRRMIEEPMQPVAVVLNMEKKSA